MRPRWHRVLAIAAFSLAFGALAVAQKAATPAQPLITQSINDSDLVTLAGNTRPEAKNPGNDRGPVADDMPMPHMMLQLRRPAALEQAFETLIDQLHDPKSPNYHHWLTATETGARFGPAASDIATVTAWLGQRGFAVNLVYPNAMVIDFSGTAGQVRGAFHTDIHRLSINGVARFANMSDPQIPASLAPVINGVIGLHDIPPRRSFAPTLPFTTGGAPQYRVAPSDLATIYNFNPLYAAGYSGQGQTIYLLETSNLYNNGVDWNTFRSALGLSSAFADGSLMTIHPAPPNGSPNNCPDPGATGNDLEAETTVDAEWSSAAAPSATIVIASCTNELVALQNLVNAAQPPAILSISFNQCEAADTAATNAAINFAYQTGAATGMSIFVSSSDNDAAMCDDRDTAMGASHGIAVNSWASTPYNVAVGGTDFSDTYSMTNGTYWSSTNTATYGSALSYIPEIPWNDSCASQLLAQFHTGSSLTYGTSGFCNTTNLRQFLSIVGGSGGPSGCATGQPSTPGQVSGTCAGWPKPTWQSGLLGNPADGVRDLPDVSLFAANGVWNHSYVTCYSDPNNSVAKGCSGGPGNWNGGGGTSISAPIFAGIQALVNQYTGSAQGNPNPVLYKLADAEYGASGSSACNSSNGNTIGSSCIFYDVTLGDIDADCLSGSPNCYLPSGTYGVLSTSTTSYQPAYPAQTGWDFATGLGTVNVYNLVTNWASVGGGDAGLTVSV
ncbi:MAG TPA: protease pro-enzyme activation domain-containing protein, partial [Xanthobacteraceae bacterium]|nr:protease pro-enzyme activation domain-containing protein [Xanthobacteraceae bacterium]